MELAHGAAQFNCPPAAGNHILWRIGRCMMRIDLSARRPSGVTVGLGPVLRGSSSLLRLWWQRSRERRQLALLTDRDLHDLDLTRIDAQREARKPFWRR